MASDLRKHAAAGDRLATLRALRDVLVAKIDDPEVAARDLASLAGRLTAVLAEIEDLSPANVDGTPLDELNRLRTDRGADPARTARTSRG